MRVQVKSMLTGAVLLVTACGAPFNYETATDLEREAWLRPRVEQYTNGFTKGLNKGPLRFEVSEPKIDIGARKVTITARATKSFKGQASPRQKRQLMEQMCPLYMRSSMYHNEIKMFHAVRHKGGATIVSFKLAPSDCEIVVERREREREKERERRKSA